jgi:hypothetical protein
LENIKIKFYKKNYDRKNVNIEKKVKGHDTHELLSPKELANHTDPNTVNKCREIYKEYLTTQSKEVKKEYSNAKNKLTAVDCHSISDHNGEWETNNLLVFDYDNLEQSEIKEIAKLVKDECLFYMLSPSAYGIKIAYVFDNILEKDFKALYKAFGKLLNQKINKPFDISCNDLRRLCYLTNDIVLNDAYTVFKIEDYRALFGIEEQTETKQTNDNGLLDILNAPLSKTGKVKINTNGGTDGTNALTTITPNSTQKNNLNSDELKELYLKEYLESAYNIAITKKINFNLSYDVWTKELLIGLIRLCYFQHDIGLEYFILFSKLCKNYGSESDCKTEYNKWKSYGGIGFKTFTTFLKSHTISVGKDIVNNLKSIYGLYYKDEKGVNQLRTNQIKRYIKQKFFRINNSFEIYYKDGNILKQGFDFETKTEHKYFDLLYYYFHVVFNELDLTESKKESIIAKIKDDFSLLEFKKITLENKDLKNLYKSDTKTEIYLYTVKGLITITKDGESFRAYEINEVIDESWIAKDSEKDLCINYDNTLNWNDYKSLDFYHKFCENDEDFEYLKRIIGYIISRERSYGMNDGILFIDGKEQNDKNGGGSGKSILCNNFQYIRKSLTITNPKEGAFLLGGLDGHSILNLEDIKWSNISIREFRAFKDLSVKVERKNVMAKNIEKTLTPRLILSSNYCPDSVDSSDERRFHIFNPTNFFNIDNHVCDYLGWFIFDYTEKEWSYWLSFMIECCKCYLKEGLNPINKWSYVKDKRKNELENSEKFVRLNNYITDYLQNQNGLNAPIELKYETIFTDLHGINNITNYIREYIVNVAKDLDYNVEFKKCLSRKDSNYNKMVMYFKGIAKEETENIEDFLN